MYAMVATRPDLAYVVGVTSRYMSNFGGRHWESVKNIFWYQRDTEYLQLTFGLNKPTEVETFTNSDYASNPNNWKSTSGYVFTYGGSTISWRSRLQDCTTLSTTEAEYVVACEATKEVICLHRLLANFSTNNQIDHPAPILHCDSQSGIHLIRNSMYHAKTKHIEVRYTIF